MQQENAAKESDGCTGSMNACVNPNMCALLFHASELICTCMHLYDTYMYRHQLGIAAKPFGDSSKVRARPRDPYV